MSNSNPIDLTAMPDTMIQSENRIGNLVSQLAHRSVSLSTKLYDLKEGCGHQSTSSDISSMAGELAMLGSTLWRLTEHMTREPLRYTQGFWQDLAELTNELQLICDEIDECCEVMRKADDPTNPVPWFFKKGRVARLNKYMETLKTSLTVMRTVLWEGASGGQTEDLQGSRNFLDAAVARNRNAINELYHLDQANAALQDTHLNSAKLPSAEDRHSDVRLAFETKCAHPSDGQSPSHMIIEDTPSVHDVEEKSMGIQKDQALIRRFSKRGVRLGVHASILDLGAHDVENVLKQKWLHESFTNRQQRLPRAGTASTRGYPHLQELPKIPEVDSQNTMLASSSVSVKDGQPQISPEVVPVGLECDSSSKDRTPSSQSKRKKRGLQLVASPIGQQLKNTISKLSMTNLRSHDRSRIGNTSSAANAGNNESRNKENDSEHFEADRISQSTGKKNSFMRSLLPGWSHGPINTPDLEDNEAMQSGLA